MIDEHCKRNLLLVKLLHCGLEAVVSKHMMKYMIGVTGAYKRTVEAVEDGVTQG